MSDHALEYVDAVLRESRRLEAEVARLEGEYAELAQINHRQAGRMRGLESIARRMLATITGCANLACNPYAEYLRFAAEGYAEDFRALGIEVG